MKNFIERLEKLKEFYKGSEYQFACNSISDAAIEIYNELHPSTEIPAPEPEKQAKEGSFKVRVTGCKNKCWWYENMIGETFEVNECLPDAYRLKFPTNTEHFIYKSDCEIIPETTVIPFDYDRWKSGDYLRVVTRDGREIRQFTEFKYKGEFPFVGIVGNDKRSWTKNGNEYPNMTSDQDLHLEIATPKPKEYWVNVFKGGARPFVVLYETEEQCVKDNIAGNFIKTIKFTI